MKLSDAQTVLDGSLRACAISGIESANLQYGAAQ
jgi:hypothetical protein